ncbi:MAG: hypothetical protein V8S24_01945 [Gordonibacter pamelaeae]
MPRRALAVLVALCLVLGQMNSGIFVAYATSGTPVTIQVGTNVTAEISDGVLTLSGTGDTDDFTAETAPFKGYAPEIRALEIEEGVTYVGACLFYGLGELGGSLTLPGSIVGFGERAFSGEGSESSAHFSVIRNLFVSGEVVRPAQAQAAPEAEPEPVPDPDPVADEPAEDLAADAPLTDGAAPEPEAPKPSRPCPRRLTCPSRRTRPGPSRSRRRAATRWSRSRSRRLRARDALRPRPGRHGGLLGRQRDVFAGGALRRLPAGRRDGHGGARRCG